MKIIKAIVSALLTAGIAAVFATTPGITSEAKSTEKAVISELPRTIVLTNDVYSNGLSFGFGTEKLLGTNTVTVTLSTTKPQNGSVITISPAFDVYNSVHYWHLYEDTWDGATLAHFAWCSGSVCIPSVEPNSISTHKEEYVAPGYTMTSQDKYLNNSNVTTKTIGADNTIQYVLRDVDNAPFGEVTIENNHGYIVWHQDGSIDGNYGRSEGTAMRETTNSPLSTLTNYNTSDHVIGFNAYSYYVNNPDLQLAIGIDGEALYQHYKTCGEKEGRMCNNNFESSPQYKELYKAWYDSIH